MDGCEIKNILIANNVDNMGSVTRVIHGLSSRKVGEMSDCEWERVDDLQSAHRVISYRIRPVAVIKIHTFDSSVYMPGALAISSMLYSGLNLMAGLSTSS